MTFVKSKKMSMLRFLPERPHRWPNTDHYINFFYVGQQKKKKHLLMDGKGSSSRNVTGNTKFKKKETPFDEKGCSKCFPTSLDFACYANLTLHATPTPKP